MIEPWQSIIAVVILFLLQSYWSNRIKRDGGWRATMLVSHRKLAMIAVQRYPMVRLTLFASAWVVPMFGLSWFEEDGLAMVVGAAMLYYWGGLTYTFDDFLKELSGNKQ